MTKTERKAYDQARNKVWREENREYRLARKKEYRAKNKELIAEKAKVYKAANPEKIKACYKAWSKKYPEKLQAKSIARRAAKINATPTWGKEAATEKIHQLMGEREQLAGAWHIDHVVPLRGKINPAHPVQLVSGLHCADNLQLLPEKDNLEKSCRYWPDMWVYTARDMRELEQRWQQTAVG